MIAIIIYNLAKRSKKASQFRQLAKEAKQNGKVVLFSLAKELTLNNKPIEDFPGIDIGGEIGIIIEPGTYNSLGTYTEVDGRGKLLNTFKDKRLKFTLEPGLEYEIGLYILSEEVLSMSVSYNKLEPQGKSDDVRVIACLKFDTLL
ncbi:MAG: hypothetical protein LBD17_00985 [Endomicrobium sp.]|nr:hypothetical protein [Endomicrobium sp.]